MVADVTADEDYAYMAWCDMRDVKPSSEDPCVASDCDGRRNQNIYFARVRKTVVQQENPKVASFEEKD